MPSIRRWWKRRTRPARNVEITPGHVECRCELPSPEVTERFAQALRAELDRMMLEGDRAPDAARKLGEWWEKRPPYDGSMIRWCYGSSWNADDTGTYTNPTI